MTYAPYPPQPDYFPPAGQVPPPTPPQSKGLGIASMVVGIVAIVLAFIPIIGFVSFLLGLVAVGLGIFAVIKNKGKGQGIAGIITGAVSLLVALAVTLMTSAFVAAVDQELQDLQDDVRAEDDQGTEAPDQVEGADFEEAEVAEESEDSGLPQAYSAMTIIGDEGALPEGEEGGVSVVAISEPDDNTSFGFILQNRTDQPVSRVEVSGRALGPDGETLGTGSSHFVDPNVVLPGDYAFGYVYVDSSDYSLPAGATIPDLNIDYTEGLMDYENIVTVDIDNFEELGNGDLTGDVTNPHATDVAGPVSVNTVCFTVDEEVIYHGTYSDSDNVAAGGSSTWTLSSYDERPECAVRLLSASGYESY